MLYRIIIRLKYSFISAPFVGLILIFMKKYTSAAFFIVGGVVMYLFFGWLEDKTRPKMTYDSDENGNAKPNYR